MSDLTIDQTHTAVRDRYGSIARGGGSCCGPTGCELLDACCRFELDVRGRVVGFEAKDACGCTPGP